MTRYKNQHGNSGVSAYEIGDDYIIIRFQNGGTYLYNYDAPGEDDVEQMKELAVEGRGLTTYINQEVRGHYYSKM